MVIIYVLGDITFFAQNTGILWISSSRDDFSSVSSGSSRASYLSDSLRLSALTEERSVEDSFNYHHVDRVVDELIQTEFTYLESLNELIHVSTQYQRYYI